jgi:hypothetical protein
VQGNRWVYEASGVDDEGEEVDETIVVWNGKTFPDTFFTQPLTSAVRNSMVTDSRF